MTLHALRIYHEKAAGRLVIAPDKARIEFGDNVLPQLKTTSDGTKVLWPQPFDDARDPQNWSDWQKHVQLAIVTLAAISPDFNVGIGIAGIQDIAETYGVSAEKITSSTTSWAVFLLGWGGILAVVLMQRLGRLPVLFWSQLLALGFLIGCALSPNLRTFAAMRFLTSFFCGVPQVTGLYVVSDVFPFHLQAHKLNVWVMGFIISPFFPPCALGYLVPRAGFRWAYGVGIIYNGIVVFLIALFGRETLLDRHDPAACDHVPPNTFANRVETLVGITGSRLARFRTPWKDLAIRSFRLMWRPHLLSLMLYEGFLFGFSIGMNLTNSLFLGEPRPLGYGFSQDAIATIYFTPIVSVLLGQLVGHHINDFIVTRAIRRNGGVYEAESRLWCVSPHITTDISPRPLRMRRSCAIALPIYVAGLIVSGAAFQNKLSVAAVIMGWGIREIAVMVNTVAIYAYANDCFPRFPGEISGLLNLFRTLGGFAMPYFQTTWARKRGSLQVFGCEAAIVAGMFFMIVPAVYHLGPKLRAKYSM
ncbi:MFS general substrate transporter [Trametes coccinea BRFM310]|uniref:MFS general substrate transporter n=1 Tax=Trametes coccinea (strain BRFM310) TaxID=1353009 RepID=A0A1Y2IIF4_TRAC3|nr:MFS general substrate transporter [Trametes coccinea BRFM310]